MSTIIDQIAKKANVSKCTVYRALKGESKENWASTKSRSDRIRKIAMQLGYRPNAAARSIRQVSFKQIACVTTRIKSDHSSSLVGYLDAAADALLEKDYLLVLESFILEKLTGKLKTPQKFFSQNSVDGVLVVIASGYCPDTIVENVQSLNLPTAWVNYNPGKACSVLSDEAQAIENMVVHYKELGHKKLAYLAPEYGHYSVLARKNHVIDSAARNGIDLTILSSPERPYIHSLVNDLFDKHPDVTGVICYHKSFFDILLYEANRRRISMPDDLSVSFFMDPVDRSITKEISVSAVEVPHELMMKRATELLLEQIDGKKTITKVSTATARFISGSTTAPCKR